MSAVLDKIRKERDQARSAALSIAESDNFNPEDENFLELQARAEQLDKRAASMATILEQQRAAEALDGRLANAAAAKEVEVRRADSGFDVVGGTDSFGDVFTRSEAFREYAQSPRGRMQKIDVDMESRALPTSIANIEAAGLKLGKSTFDATPPQAPTPLLDNISRVEVSNNAVEFVAWAKVAGGAAVVAEGAAKPSAEWAPSVVADSLDNIAVYTQLTRQLIEDAPAVRSLINGELIRDVQREEEAQAAAALTGATLPTATGADLLAAIRSGIGTVQAAGYSPNAVMLNPADWAALDNVVMSSTLNGPTIRQNFWGLVPVPNIGQAQGTAVVGDFRTAMTQYFRSSVSLYVTDSHADTFLLNVFTLLAERRSLTRVVKPQALVEVSAAVTP